MLLIQQHVQHPKSCMWKNCVGDPSTRAPWGLHMRELLGGCTDVRQPITAHTLVQQPKCDPLASVMKYVAYTHRFMMQPSHIRLNMHNRLKPRSCVKVLLKPSTCIDAMHIASCMTFDMLARDQIKCHIPFQIEVVSIKDARHVTPQPRLH